MRLIGGQKASLLLRRFIPFFQNLNSFAPPSVFLVLAKFPITNLLFQHLHIELQASDCVAHMGLLKQPLAVAFIEKINFSSEQDRE